MRAAALVVAALLVAPAGLSAQGTAGRPAPNPKPAGQDSGGRDARPAWIGVGLSGRTACRDDRGGPARAAPACRTTFIAETVVLGSPADSAGIEPGDTLLTIDGQALGTEGGEKALADLTAGHGVQVRIGRGDGEHTLQVVPAARPSGTPIVRLRVAGVDEEGPGVVRVRLGSLAGAPGGLPLVRARRPFPPGWGESAIYTLPLAPRETPDGSRTVIHLDMGGRAMTWRSAEGASVDSLSPELRALRDSVLQEARARLDSLRAVFRSQKWADFGSGDGLEASERTARLAGAEFRALNPDLAAYFRGADSGLLVLRVLPGTPAGSLGLRPGDVVVRAAGESVRDAVDLRSALMQVAPSDSVTVVWIRKGRRMQGVLRGR